MIVKYKLLGQPVNPVNRSEITLEVNHDQESVINQPKPHVGINNLYFAREDILRVMSYLNNAPGITEGAPFDIEITEKGQTQVVNMYLNLMEGLKRSNDGIEASVKMLQSVDWLEDRIDGFTFESMYNETGVAPFVVDGIPYSSYQQFFDKRCVYIPYVLSSIPNRQDAFQAIFSISYVVIELTKGIKFVVQWATPIPDGAGGAFAIGQLIAEIAFIVLLIAALVVLIIHLFNCLIQPVKFHGAMLIVDMLKIVCVKLGLNFQSSIWTTYPYNQLAYLPEKYNPLEEANPNPNSVFGITFAGFAKSGFTSPGYATGAVHDSSDSSIQKGYFDGTGGDFIRFVKKICNGKIIIPNQTTDLLLERRDFYPAATPYQLPDIRQDWNGYNTDELVANILIRFAEDLNDKNCIDKYIGTILQATHSQILTNDQRLVLLKGLREVMIGAARGVRKENLNMIETIHLVMEIAYNSIQNTGIALINATIDVFNIAIKIINIIIGIWNALMDIIDAIITVVNNIITAISSLFGGSGLGTFTGLHLNIVPINPVAHLPLVPLIPSSYQQRIDTLLLENDMVTTPKLLLVDTKDNVRAGRTEFTGAGGYSGQKRIAYLHTSNDTVVNAKWIWDKFYFIDAFVGAVNNRFTKIAPATNKPSESNPVLLSLPDFLNIVSNPKIKDNFAEDVITDSVQWRIGDETGRAEFSFRKQGWLRNPQSNVGAIRSQEININLQLKTSLPNGQ